MDDTPQEIKDLVRQMMMQRSSAERVLMACKSFGDMKQMILASFPPGLSEIETKRRLCERLYGDEVDVEGFVRSLEESEKRIHLENNNES